VTSATARSRAPTSANDSLTGADINESTLGQVPSANTTNSATTAGTAANANNLGGQPASAFDSANETIPFSVRIAGDGEKTIATIGPFRVFARCDANESATTHELTELVMTTTNPNSAFDDNNGPEFVPWDPADEAVLQSFSSTDPDLEAESFVATANSVGANGAGVIVHSYALGANLGGTTDTCWVQGVIESTQLPKP
jgi:hypothetical protein